MSSPAPVPPAAISVAGEAYGGAYWDRAEYRVTLTRTEVYPTSVSGHLASVVLEDVQGTEIQRFDLDVRMATNIIDELDSDKPVRHWEIRRAEPATPLVTKVLWKMGDDRNAVTLDGELNEIHAWLRCAVGLDQYPDEEWEY